MPETISIHITTNLPLSSGLGLALDRTLPATPQALARALRHHVRSQLEPSDYPTGTYHYDDFKIYAFNESNILSQEPAHLALLKAAAHLDHDHSTQCRVI